MKEYISYFRKEIDSMEGYTPGEQPKDRKIIKLNTNESPSAPSPLVAKALADFDCENLRLYPDPVFTALREEIAKQNGVEAENVIAGNGSDDILTITARCFSSSEKPLACFTPSYSLYKTLAGLQGAPLITIPLEEDFSMPANTLSLAEKANLFMIARPNAPTGNLFPMEKMEEICENFKGIVFIDEAYADFSIDSCVSLVKKHPNVIVSRTFSKSRCLAGLRFGYAIAHKEIIAGLMKMKDSYNVPMLTQKLAMASLKDPAFFDAHVKTIISNRAFLTEELAKMGFTTIPSYTNFIFTKPPCGGEKYFKALREKGIIVRYFPGSATGDYVRITIGSRDECEALLKASGEILN